MRSKLYFIYIRIHVHQYSFSTHSSSGIYGLQSSIVCSRTNVTRTNGYEMETDSLEKYAQTSSDTDPNASAWIEAAEQPLHTA